MLDKYSNYLILFTFFVLNTVFILLGTEIATAQCSDSGNYWNKSWKSCTTSPNPNPIRGNSHWIMYEFQTNQNIDSTHIWNANKVGESQYGINEVIVDYSTDGSTWEELGTYNFPQASELDTYQGFTGPNFGGEYIKKIVFTIVSTHGTGDCASVSEVQFKVTDEVCNGVLDECNVCDGPGAPTWYLDADNDGKGDANVTLVDCLQPTGYVMDNTDPCDDGTLGWSDMATLFDENNCTNCHNSVAMTSGLNLESYPSFMSGGDNCGPFITVGTTLSEIILVGNVSCNNGTVETSMNTNVGFAISMDEIAQIQEWIDSGAPEYCYDACSGTLDECGVCDGPGESTWYADLDGDGLGDPASSITTCFPPNNYTDNADDGDDTCFGFGTGVCGDCSGTISNQIVEAKVLLEGPYMSSGNMHTNLLDSNLLPTDQPFNRSPWNYAGTESVVGFPSNVTDWVLVEARCIDDPSQFIERKAAFVRNDGTIISPDGSTGVEFSFLKPGSNYHLVIRSRNHLAIAGDNYLNIPQVMSYDLTAVANVYGGSTQVSATSDGFHVMKAGEFNSNGVYTIYDFNSYYGNSSLMNQYSDIDCNFDGNVTVADYNLYRTNASAISIDWLQY